MLIGLGHRKRVGKDTIADYLVREHGFQKLAFADPLKEAAKVVFGWNDEHVHGELKEAKDPYWGFAPRWALQRMGTDAMRKHFADDIWVKATLRRVQAPGRYVISDVRFPNEAEAIQRLGGRVWRVDRPQNGLPAKDAHESEVALLRWEGWDGILYNNGTLRNLFEATDRLMRFGR